MPKDGVIDFLKGLRARGIKMAIATLTARRHAEKALIDRDVYKRQVLSERPAAAGN